MEKLIDAESAKFLKDRFASEMKEDVSIHLYTKGEGEYAQFSKQMVEELAELTDKIKLKMVSDEEAGTLGMKTDPTFLIGKDQGFNIIYNGSPAGHEAGAFIEGLVMASSGNSQLSPQHVEQLQSLDKDIRTQVFVTPSCPHCPQSAILAMKIAVANPEKVTAEVVEAQENMELSQQFRVSSVPQQVINGDLNSITVGAQPDTKFVDQVLQYGSSRYEELKKEAEEKSKQSEILADNPDGLLKVTDANFDEAVAKYPNLVIDCWAEWCGPCRMVGPIIEALSQDHKGKIVYGKLNVDENPATSAKYGITSIPSILLFKDGQMITNLVGAKPKAQLEKEILENLG